MDNKSPVRKIKETVYKVVQTPYPIEGIYLHNDDEGMHIDVVADIDHIDDRRDLGSLLRRIAGAHEGTETILFHQYRPDTYEPPKDALTFYRGE